jgi:hypothetical protein
MEKRLWILVEVSEQKWINDALKCGFRILKWITHCIQLIWSAPHRACQRPLGMCSRPRAIGQAKQENPDHGGASAPASHLSTPRSTSPRPWVSVRAHVYLSAPAGISSRVPKPV